MQPLPDKGIQENDQVPRKALRTSAASLARTVLSKSNDLRATSGPAKLGYAHTHFELFRVLHSV